MLDDPESLIETLKKQLQWHKERGTYGIREPDLKKHSESLQMIREDLGDCQRCKLSSMRTHIVFGDGAPDADIMFVGEAPGEAEDQQGLPFVGRSGQLLTKMIAAMGYNREDVYIANVLKCRPPKNRDPESDEIVACRSFLFRQIIAIDPQVIITLGRPAIQLLLDTKEPLSKFRGMFQFFQNIPVMPTYHPAYLLRSPSKKKDAWEDLQKVMTTIKK